MIIDEIRKLRAKGLSQHEIAADLNKRKIKTKRGKAWKANTVSYALRSGAEVAKTRGGDDELKTSLEAVEGVLSLKLKPAAKIMLIKNLVGQL